MGQGATMEGTPVRIGTREFIVPDPTLETAENVALKLEEIAARGISIKVLIDVAEVITIALRENYPDITVAEVKKLLKMKDAIRVMKEILRAVGLEGPETGEAVAP